jgi:hypothetical protein
MIKPIKDWNGTRVYEKLTRDEKVRVVLSPMMSHAARGRPSLSILATTEMYV